MHVLPSYDKWLQHQLERWIVLAPTFNNSPGNSIFGRCNMYRKPLRVKTGCVRCRRRRKKCDESKPTCRGCARLGLSCIWLLPQTSTLSASWTVVASKVLEAALPIQELESLSTANSKHHAESTAIARFPSILKLHHTSACSSEAHDITAVMQMTFTNRCVRKSIVIFSLTAMSSQKGVEQLNLEAWGKALSTIQSKLTHTSWEANGLFELLIAVLFLAEVEVSTISSTPKPC